MKMAKEDWKLYESSTHCQIGKQELINKIRQIIRSKKSPNNKSYITSSYSHLNQTQLSKTLNDEKCEKHKS